MTDFAAIEVAIDNLREDAGSGGAGHDTVAAAGHLLALGERILETWIASRGGAPTHVAREGFRLLALQRQGARGEPSFNACRETCRELAYHFNLISGEPEHPEASRRLMMMALVARHLLLFVQGKLEVAGLGEFCCAAKPARAGEA